MNKKELGKISSAVFGLGGYQDVQFGYWFSFSMPGSGVGTGEGVWTGKPPEGAKWTVETRRKFLAEITEKVMEWMEQAKVSNFNELVGIPVELTFEDMRLKSWRILTEVL